MLARARMRIAWDRLSAIPESDDLAESYPTPIKHKRHWRRIRSDPLSSVTDIVGSGEDLDQAEGLHGRLRSSSCRPARLLGRLLTWAAMVVPFSDGLTQLSDPCPEINQTHNFARTRRRICAKTRVRLRSNTFDVS